MAGWSSLPFFSPFSLNDVVESDLGSPCPGEGSFMLVAFQSFPAEEQAAFQRLCSNLGLNQPDFELEAEVASLDLAAWRSQPHIVVVTHRPTSRARICSGWPKRTWLDAFDDQVRKNRFLL